jgi:hypothetical protein
MNSNPDDAHQLDPASWSIPDGSDALNLTIPSRWTTVELTDGTNEEAWVSPQDYWLDLDALTETIHHADGPDRFLSWATTDQKSTDQLMSYAAEQWLDHYRRR